MIWCCLFFSKAGYRGVVYEGVVKRWLGHGQLFCLNQDGQNNGDKENVLMNRVMMAPVNVETQIVASLRGIMCFLIKSGHGGVDFEGIVRVSSGHGLCGPVASALLLTLLSFCFAKKKEAKKKAIGKIAPPHKASASCRFPKAKLPAHVLNDLVLFIFFEGGL